VSVLNRKLYRELIGGKWMFLAIVGIMAVGVICFVGWRALYYNLRDAQHDYYATCRMADFWIDLKKAPRTDLRRAAGVEGITRWRARIVQLATVDLDDVDRPLSGLVISMPDRPAEVINDIVVRRGTYFSDQQANQVIVGDAFARARGLGPGDRLHLLLGNRRQELLVVGTAISSEFVYLLRPGSITPDVSHFGVFYLKRTFLEDVLDMDGAANQLIGQFTTTAPSRRAARLAEIEQLLESFGVDSATLRKDQASHLFLSSEIRGLGVFATILPAIFLSVAALVLNVLMARVIDNQRTVIGTLKAIGYTNTTLFAHYLKMGLVVGLAGGLIGCGFGYLLAEGVTHVYRRFFEFPRLENAFYPGVSLTGLLISLTCAVLGALRGAWAALRLDPAGAMRPRPPGHGGRIVLERMTALWKRLSFRARLALRNTFRNRLRTAAALLATSLGTSLLVVGFMSIASMHFLVDFQFEQVTRSDFDLTFQSARDERAMDEVRRFPGVDHAEPVLRVACTFSNGPHHRKGSITGLIPAARLTIPRDRSGRRLRIPEAGLLMTRKMAEVLHVTAGDHVAVVPTRGLRRKVLVTVAEVAESYLGTEVYTNIAYLNRLVGEARTVSGAQLTVLPDPTTRTAFYRQLKRTPAIAGVTARTEMIANIEKLILETQNMSIAILVGFAGIISCGAILNVSLVSLMERRRELATLRVLGYGPWQVGGLLLRESLLVTTLGAVLGLPLGYACYRLMARLYDMTLLRLPTVSATWVWTTSVCLAMVFGGVAHAVVQWKIHHMDWLEELKVNE